ncbi:hypothetical protein ACFYNL_25545 [Streptomyces sp. NPDC007808]|uniref:hypothetical protein n=1 Tax=Streptomyces sp. NPDC007808 TaxID=3364779 RepID=UPI0036B1CC67
MASFARRLASVTGAVGATTATLLYVASPASAAIERYAVSTVGSGSYPTAAGSLDFYTYDDSFNICDNSSDGAGVVGSWKIGTSGAVESRYNGNGRATCVSADENFAESATIYIRVCLQDNGDLKESTCSPWKRAYADGVG